MSTVQAPCPCASLTAAGPKNVLHQVIRMLYSIVGSSGFADGMKLYFERFDGQAVVCEDFVMAM